MDLALQAVKVDQVDNKVITASGLNGMGLTSGVNTTVITEMQRAEVAMFFLSTPYYSGVWEVGNDGLVNDAFPQSCARTDTHEIALFEVGRSFERSSPRSPVRRMVVLGGAHEKREQRR